MSFHAPHTLGRIRSGRLASSPRDGNNGAFRFPSSVPGRTLHVLCSDGMGWEHVSVSIVGRSDRTPTWGEMRKVKDLFWDEEDVVIQYHPAKSEYVSYHNGCLHMWRPTEQEIPTPPSLCVGPVRETKE